MKTLKEMIYSEDYAEFLLNNYALSQEAVQNIDPELGKVLYLNAQYSVLYFNRTLLPENLFNVAAYQNIPGLFTTQDTISLESAGILPLQNQPLLGLTGRGVILGFIDTGIDYTHPAFLDERGKSRILYLWDQTRDEADAVTPRAYPYGWEYTRDDINRALEAEDPAEIVPETDELGHGTAVAGIAAGSANPSVEFSGAAPGCDIVVVKLKEAKEYLKRLYLISGSGPAYAEQDIMAGLRYLSLISEQEKKPLIICIALGSNQGGHLGTQPLAVSLDRISQLLSQISVVACGNESGKAHHYYGGGTENAGSTSVEILVPDNSRGFACELWGQVPQLFSVSFRTPLGETYPNIPITFQGNDKISFILEDTVIYVNYDTAQPISGNQLVLMRFVDPTPGIWTVTVTPSRPGSVDFHMWLPISNFNVPDVRFVTPNPYTTLTAPSDAESVISVGAYNALNRSLYIHSGRGFTADNGIKPDFTAPGVDVSAPGPANSYFPSTGTSSAAAITAGACALLTEWGIRREPPLYFSAQQMKIYLIRGCTQSDQLTYPNREWGYGTLNLYETFLAFTVR